MQGRLLPPVGNRIQCFPGDNWPNELEMARHLDLDLIEWTIDYQTHHANPILDRKSYQSIITELSIHQIGLESITCDFFMERPPWLSDGNYRINQEFLNRLSNFADYFGNLKLVIPLVDHGSLPNSSIFFEVVLPLLEETNGNSLTFLFESDYEPQILAYLMSSLSENRFGINLDIGNSASFGWKPENEVRELNKFIQNVHVKDRLRNGPSVRLGEGSANFYSYLDELKTLKYKGNFILQTARAQDGNHFRELEVNCSYFRSILDKIGFDD